MSRRSQSPHGPRRVACLVASIVATLALSSFAGVAEAALSWRGDFETGSFAQWLDGGGIQALQGPADVVQDRVRDGAYAARFEVRPNSDPNADGGDRSELLYDTQEDEGDESWWAWSTYFGDDFNPNPDTHWNIFTQWHHNGSTGQANVNFEVNTRYAPWKIQMRTFGGQADKNQQIFLLADLERNRWYDFVFHVRWAPDNTGFVEVWLNGVPVVPLTHRPTTYAGEGVYLKQGLYRGPSGLTSALYLDGTRRGTSFDDVTAPIPALQPNVSFRRRPSIVPRRRMAVHARTSPGTLTDVVVRGPNGSRLGSARLRAGARGRLDVRVRLPRWTKQRRLKVTVRAHLPNGARRATRVVRLSRRAVHAAQTR
jgi:hypothetical protein